MKYKIFKVRSSPGETNFRTNLHFVVPITIKKKQKKIRNHVSHDCYYIRKQDVQGGNTGFSGYSCLEVVKFACCAVNVSRTQTHRPRTF